MTNGDWIRSMTDEELADFLNSYEARVCAHCKYDVDSTCIIEDENIVCTRDYVHEVYVNWLSSEADTECLEKDDSLLPIR